MNEEHRKNLIIIHIESLSNLLYFQNKSIFKNLQKVKDNCAVYNNFYSTGTSTLMVLADLFYGDMSRFEESENLSCLKSPDSNDSLIHVLKDAGYNIRCVFLPEWSSADNEALVSILGQVTYKSSLGQFNQEIHSVVQNEKPFSLFIYNGISGISFLPSGKGKTWRKSWKEGYTSADDTIGYVFSLLEQYSLMDDTVVVMYGDHGDDFWSHGFNNGFCHSIEPYANMVHTPLIVYNKSIGKQKLDDVISTVDLRDLILDMLDIKEKTGKESMIYDGLRSHRKYAFSRNLFAAQSNTNHVLSKCYSVSDGDYNLLVTEYGLEFYLECLDGGNQCNLLQFYDMNHDGKINLKSKYKSNSNRHFTKVMTKEHSEEIENDFYRMLSVLKKRVKELYIHAGLEEIWQDELCFTCINLNKR